MDEFKISLFESEHAFRFPQYQSLGKIEGQKLMNNIAEKYNINLTNFEAELAMKQSFCEEFNGEEDFKLKHCLTSLGIKLSNSLCINWYKFERVDVLTVDDLDKYFYDLWFPSADDIDLFDHTLNWIVSIRHDGCVSWIKHTDSI